MQIGALRHKVTVQKPDPDSAYDDAGQRVTEWLDVVADYWADIRSLSGGERFAAAQQQSIRTHVIRMRWCPALASIDAAWRVQFGARVFAIESADNVNERNVELVLRVVEGARDE